MCSINFFIYVYLYFLNGLYTRVIRELQWFETFNLTLLKGLKRLKVVKYLKFPLLNSVYFVSHSTWHREIAKYFDLLKLIDILMTVINNIVIYAYIIRYCLNLIFMWLYHHEFNAIKSFYTRQSIIFTRVLQFFFDTLTY